MNSSMLSLEQMKQLLLSALAYLKGLNKKNMPTEPTPAQPAPTAAIPDTFLDWNTIEGAHHNTRVCCDLEGLNYDQKQVLTACVRVESGFNIGAVHANRDGQGRILSTDYGIAQINSYWNIGPGKAFPSAEYVLSHPEECIRFMCRSYKELGDLRLWCSYTSGEFKNWLNRV